MTSERSPDAFAVADLDVGTGRLLADGAHAGTAWLMTAKHALTAAHCVGDRVAKAPSEAAFSIEFRDGIKMGCRLARVDWKLDVALLELEGEARQPLVPIGNAPPHSTEPGVVAWRSFGYPVAHPDGMTLSGTVTSLTGTVDGAPAVELECRQGGAGSLEGVSGSPVRRGRIAFALIRYGPPALQQRVVHATSLDLVAAVFEEVRTAWLPLDLDLDAYRRALSERVGIGGDRLDDDNRFVPLLVRGAVAGSEPIGLLEAIRAHQRILVRGEAGAGKSTLLRQLAMRSANGKGEVASDNAEVPDVLCLHLPLAEFEPHYELVTPWEALLEFVAEQLVALRAVTEKPRRDKVEALLKRTAPILLFDGRNEIAPKHRARFAAVAVACVEHDLRFVVTDRLESALEYSGIRLGLRPQADESAQAEARSAIPATEMTLLSLDNQQLERFARSRVAPERAAIVVEEAQRNPLLRVPLFADMALALDSEERSSLQSATALVAEYVRKLTERWASHAKIPEQEQQRVIRAGRLLAGRMDQSYRIGMANAVQAFANDGLLESAAAGHLSMLKACGFVRVDVSDGDSVIAFTHQALQEHFLAGSLAERWRATRSGGKRLPPELREPSMVLLMIAKLKAVLNAKPTPSAAHATLREAAWVHLGAILDGVELEKLLPLLAIRNRLLAICILDELALARRDVRLDPPLRRLTRELRRIAVCSGPLVVFLPSLIFLPLTLSSLVLVALAFSVPARIFNEPVVSVGVLMVLMFGGSMISLRLVDRYLRNDVLLAVLRAIPDVRSPEMRRFIESFAVSQTNSGFAWKRGLAKTLLLARNPERAMDLLRAAPALHQGIACLVYTPDPQAKRILELLGETRTAYSRIARDALVEWRKRWCGASTVEHGGSVNDAVWRGRVRWTVVVVLVELLAIIEMLRIDSRAIDVSKIDLWGIGSAFWIVLLVFLERIVALVVTCIVAFRSGARSMAGTNASNDPAGRGVLRHCYLAWLLGMAYVLIWLLPYRGRICETAQIDCDWIEAQLAFADSEPTSSSEVGESVPSVSP